MCCFYLRHLYLEKKLKLKNNLVNQDFFYYICYTYFGDIMGNFSFKKKYGQNFLIDKNIIKKIENLFDKKANSLVMEVGCGDGRLTSILCENFDFVLGYEIDSEVKDLLYERLKDYSNFKIIFDDFMKSNFVVELSKYNYEHLFVIANIPYYITTPIIESIINSKCYPDKMIFMVQKEVAERLSAKVGTKDYNSFTIFINYFYEVKKEFVVPKNCFYPVPNVDSAIVSFNKRQEVPFVKDLDLFYKLIRDSFQFNRKTLKNNLKLYDLEKIALVLSKYNLDLSVRPAQVSIEIYCDIANNLCI